MPCQHIPWNIGTRVPCRSLVLQPTHGPRCKATKWNGGETGYLVMTKDWYWNTWRQRFMKLQGKRLLAHHILCLIFIIPEKVILSLEKKLLHMRSFEYHKEYCQTKTVQKTKKQHAGFRHLDSSRTQLHATKGMFNPRRRVCRQIWIETFKWHELRALEGRGSKLFSSRLCRSAA